MAKCQLCRERRASWAMQYVAEDRPSFYRLGSHIRGFRVYKVCSECKEEAIAAYRNESSELVPEGES